MQCTNPLTAYINGSLSPTAKKDLCFNKEEAIRAFGFANIKEIQVPCGKCLACRLLHSAEWGARCYHELKTCLAASFITLTYRPEDLPADGSVSNEHHQLFMKRLRKRIAPQRIRYFMCAEYGKKHARPHYHYIIFGYDFPDKKLFQVKNGTKLYRSEMLEDLWPYGFCTVCDVNYEACCYVARYTSKKLHGNKGAQWYQAHGIKPEFCRASNRAGIGYSFVKSYMSDIFPSGKVSVLTRKGIKHFGVPRYYQKICEREFPELFAKFRTMKVQFALDRERSDREQARLAGQSYKEYLQSKLNRLLEYGRATFKANYRSYENDLTGDDALPFYDSIDEDFADRGAPNCFGVV